MADLSFEDIVQQYNQTSILYKGKPHKVHRVGIDFVTLTDPYTQRRKEVEFKLKDFSPIVMRLGMVNIDGVVVYVSRDPKKQYQTGISNTNTKFNALDAMAPVDRVEMREKVKYMECPEWADMLVGHYPTLESAWNQCNKLGGAVAFDKQFAVDCQGQVFYRTNVIGRYMEKKKKIAFNPDTKHFSILLKDGHEEAPRTFR